MACERTRDEITQTIEMNHSVSTKKKYITIDNNVNDVGA